MKSSATAQQDSSGPYSVWCRNCCEGHRQIISCHYCAPGKGIKRSTKASGEGVDPTTKQSRISQEPTWAWPEPPCRWWQTFQLLQDALSQTLVGALYSSAWLCHRACNKQAGWIQQFGRDGDAAPKTVIFWRESCSSLLSPDLQQRAFRVVRKGLYMCRRRKSPFSAVRATQILVSRRQFKRCPTPQNEEIADCWGLQAKKMAFLNAYYAIHPPFPTPLFSPHLIPQAIFHSAACAQLGMPRANMTQCSWWTVLNKVHLKTSADTAQHHAWW